MLSIRRLAIESTSSRRESALVYGVDLLALALARARERRRLACAAGGRQHEAALAPVEEEHDRGERGQADEGEAEPDAAERLPLEEHDEPERRRRDAEHREDERQRDLGIAQPPLLLPQPGQQAGAGDEVQGAHDQQRDCVQDESLCLLAHSVVLTGLES